MIAIPETIVDSVKRILARCWGPTNALTLAAIAEQVTASRRDVEATIEHNLDAFPFPLVSGAAGIYIPTNADCINRYLHSLHSRHRRMQIREETTRRKAKACGWKEQDGKFINPAAGVQHQTELF